MKKILIYIHVFVCAIVMVSCDGSKNGFKSGDDDSICVDSEYVDTVGYDTIDYDTIDWSQLDVDEIEEDTSDLYVCTMNTGDVPYACKNLRGGDSRITVRTSASQGVVAIVKRNNVMVRNAYIEAGDSYTFNIPNGKYQVFFYGGEGWSPEKEMGDGLYGGFIADESFSKDEPVSLEYQELTYELISQIKGNFSTEPSSRSEIF